LGRLTRNLLRIDFVRASRLERINLRIKVLVCAFRNIRPPIPTASGHLNRGIRPPMARCVEA
ncbi:MAG TPA: hypothetical protein VMX97_10015, partial [Hyphomicrobiaceae bacterium]|nr:hypothetical protein [Hyphomicrobiaceae bacterium]